MNAAVEDEIDFQRSSPPLDGRENDPGGARDGDSAANLDLPDDLESGYDGGGDDEDFDDDEEDPYDMFNSDEEDSGALELEVKETTVPISKPQGLKVILKSYRQGDNDEFKQWMETLIVTCTHEGKEIGRGFGRYGLSSIAFELFDRYGRVKEEYITHPIRKGTGYWGAELDLGNLFVLEQIAVKRDFRRQGVGSAIVNALVVKAHTGERDTAFTIVSPSYLPRDVEEESKGKSKQEHREIVNRAHHAASAHKAHTILASEDFDLPELGPETEDDDTEEADDFFGTKTKEKAMKRLEAQLPLHHTVLSLADEKCVEYFETYKTAGNQAEWIKTERYGKNILHQAACELKPKSVQWLLDNVDDGKRLSLGRSRDGYTPLESLMAQLETERSTRQQGMATVVTSDSFGGFIPDAISCMAALRGLQAPSGVQILQLKFGCTCGECFSNIFDHAATALRSNRLPTINNLIEIWQDSSEWPPVTRNFYQRGGTTESALRWIFEFARDQDQWAGDGEHTDIFEEYVDALPKCRNDHEFGFVALACGVPKLG
ncbi:hypothetical protein BKA61DRAFT_465054 [Leptodontidium sp. MPI-SDFR-AT-0119]|nr:hypothetical protein BKA61DRAFT_465054 [Leptodontidium sp. MPI-SDFR-AT-0119]